MPMVLKLEVKEMTILQAIREKLQEIQMLVDIMVMEEQEAEAIIS